LICQAAEHGSILLLPRSGTDEKARLLDGNEFKREDAPADEVEHHSPKDLYPELVFVWRNYLYACGPCNRRKNNHFSIIDIQTEALVDVSRARRRYSPTVARSPRFD